jgi:hypothetical protein
MQLRGIELWSSLPSPTSITTGPTIIWYSIILACALIELSFVHDNDRGIVLVNHQLYPLDALLCTNEILEISRNELRFSQFFIKMEN